MANSGAKRAPSGVSAPLPRIASAGRSGIGGRSRLRPRSATIAVSAVSSDCSMARMKAPAPPSAQETLIIACALAKPRIRATASPRPAPPMASSITAAGTPSTLRPMSQLMLSARIWYWVPRPTRSW